MSWFACYQRNRVFNAVATIFVIALGLASRRFPGLLPTIFRKYPGDVLWALMVYFGLGFFRKSASILSLAVLALSISYLDEFSQLYQAPWINTIRSTTFGHLVLGSTFSWQDILSYTIGVSFGVLLEISFHFIQNIDASTSNE